MENLKILRKQYGYTQLQAAKIFNMSLRGYQDIENGICGTTNDRLIEFANHFGCSIDYLLGHQTQQIMHLDSLTENQQKAISMIRKLGDDEIILLLGYLARMTNTPLEEVLKNQSRR